MAYFLQQLINGIALGSIYGLIAIGYTMVYGIIGMINFAHGEIFMIGAFVSLITFLLMGVFGITWVPLAILVMLLVTAIGMSVFFQNYVQLLQGARPRPLQPLIRGTAQLWSVSTPDGRQYP